MSRPHVDLIRELLDHEVVDSEGLPCGVVDDVELAGPAEKPTGVAALLLGPGAWGPRLPRLVGVIAMWIAGRRVTRVPWNQVHRVGEQIVLKDRATALGLGKTDRRAGQWLKWIPGNEKAH